MKKVAKVSVLAAALLASASSAFAASVFSDDFNRDSLNPDTSNPLWVGKNGAASGTTGEIVGDPIASGNGVLRFRSVNSGGDAFSSLSKAFNVAANVPYELSFRYLGTPVATNGNGGFIGLSDGIPGNHNWLAGTQLSAIGPSGLVLTIEPAAAADRVLQDDGTWHSYSIQFTSPTAKTLRVMMEDFVAPAQNAYFDDIAVNVVPLPAACWGGALLLGALGIRRTRRTA